MSLGYRGHIEYVAAVAAMTVIAAGGCVTHPRPVAEAIVAGSSKPAVGSGAGAASGAAGPAPERHTALEKQLNDSLAAFDMRLRQEQQKTASERDARQATVATTTSPDPDASPAERPGPHGGDLKSERTEDASGNVAGNGAPANVIPDGNDDDIVARRLRKAAQQETDPELKDKLWKEYVEYKKNTQVR